jgi:hypothetical protein
VAGEGKLCGHRALVHMGGGIVWAQGVRAYGGVELSGGREMVSFRPGLRYPPGKHPPVTTE